VAPKVPVRLFVILASAVTAGALLASERAILIAQDQDGAIPTFRSSVEAVHVTAIVTDANGVPVTGLTRDDFEIQENGQLQPITTFSAVDLPIARVERTLGEPDVLGNDGPPGRTYVIAFDDMNPQQAERARALLRQFVHQYFGPNDRGTVVATTVATAGSRTGQGFTSNPRLLLDAIDRFTGGSSPTGADAGSAELAESIREKYLMNGLRDLTALLAKTPGRKALIFVSGKGLGSTRSTQACGCNALKLVDYAPGPLGGLFFDMNRSYHDALSAATRGNVAFLRDDFALSGIVLTSDLTRDTFTISPHERMDVDFPGPPTTTREFSHDDALTVFAELYENRRKPHTVFVTVELRDEAGQVLDRHALQRSTVVKPKRASVHAFAPRLFLDDVPAGHYAVRVEARSSLDSNRTVSREVPISVR
jgi:VWFA-related protein